MGTVAVHDGLLYAADLAGFFYCLDARTGKKQWIHDFQEGTWCSPYYVDGKVYVGTDSGDVYIFKHGRKPNTPRKIPMGNPIKVPVAVSSGVLYVNTGSYLYAIAPKK
jgi:outer membrane protein assembly factor BamB